MDTLEEAAQNPEIKSAYFDPDSGELVLGKTHKSTSESRMVEYVRGFEKNVEELLAEREQLMARWDQLDAERKQKMGDVRTVNVETDPKSMDLQKVDETGKLDTGGKSGEEMVAAADEEYAPKLQEISDRVAEIDALIPQMRASIEKFKGQGAYQMMKSGWVVLSKFAPYDPDRDPDAPRPAEVWHFMAPMASKVNTDHSKKLLEDMRRIFGSVVVTFPGSKQDVQDTFDQYKENVDTFVSDLMKKSASLLTSVSPMWLHRAGSKRVAWYD